MEAAPSRRVRDARRPARLPARWPARRAGASGKRGRTRAAVPALLAVSTLLGALAGCGNASVTIYAGPEQTPQSIQLTATARDAGSVALAWTSAGSGLAYRIERNGNQVGTTSGLDWLAERLAGGERYCWRVFAYGGFGWQARSNEACVGTDPGEAGWRIERLAAGRWPAVAVDASGDVHVCFTGVSGGLSYLRAGPGREPELVDAVGSGQCSIAAGADGVVDIAYLSPVGLRHARRSAGVWAASTVDVEALVGTRRFDGPALALGSDGRPRIAYRRFAGTTVPTVAIATREESGWRFELTGLAGLLGPRSLAIAPDARLRLALNDDLGQFAQVRVRDTTGWVLEYSHARAPNRGDGLPLALDATSAPRVASWHRDANAATDAPTTLRWAEVVDGTWRTQTVGTFATAGFRIAIAVSGATARVATSDQDGTLRLFVRDGERWVVDPFPLQGGAAAAVDLAIGPDGQTRMVYDRVTEGSVVLASRAP